MSARNMQKNHKMYKMYKNVPEHHKSSHRKRMLIHRQDDESEGKKKVLVKNRAVSYSGELRLSPSVVRSLPNAR